MSTGFLLALLSVICFAIAAFPNKLTVRFEWLGAAFFVARLLVVVSLLAILPVATACATVDQFNKVSADVVQQAIVASEDHRCSVHPAPCLSDDEFKAVNVDLNKVSTAGIVFTKLRIAGTSTVADANTFLAAVADASSALAKRFPDGRIGAVLAKLIELQSKAVQFLGK